MEEVIDSTDRQFVDGEDRRGIEIEKFIFLHAFGAGKDGIFLFEDGCRSPAGARHEKSRYQTRDEADENDPQDARIRLPLQISGARLPKSGATPRARSEYGRPV